MKILEHFKIMSKNDSSLCGKCSTFHKTIAMVLRVWAMFLVLFSWVRLCHAIPYSWLVSTLKRWNQVSSRHQAWKHLLPFIAYHSSYCGEKYFCWHFCSSASKWVTHHKFLVSEIYTTSWTHGALLQSLLSLPWLPHVDTLSAGLKNFTLLLSAEKVTWQPLIGLTDAFPSDNASIHTDVSTSTMKVCVWVFNTSYFLVNPSATEVI